jgi:hypothetical protein
VGDVPMSDGLSEFLERHAGEPVGDVSRTLAEEIEYEPDGRHDHPRRLRFMEAGTE